MKIKFDLHTLHIIFSFILVFLTISFFSCKTKERIIDHYVDKIVVKNVFVSPRDGQTWSAEVTDNSDMSRQLDSLCHCSPIGLTSIIGIEVVDLSDERVIYAHNRWQRMRPASCMKILTAITALDIFGKDYKYYPEIPYIGWGWCWDDEETKRIPYTSTTLMSVENILQPMLKKSDNFMAESMFCQLAQSIKAPIEDRKASSKSITLLMNKIGIDDTKYCIADGSGLSLYNYISVNVLVEFLKYAYKNNKIYNPFVKSLPLAGVDGTLKGRMQGTPAFNNVRAKTGSVTAVSSLSGYCTTSNGHTLCFSIINQGIEKTSIGREFQDEACSIMCR